MVCTFGDTTDVVWWRELRLATRPVIGWDGRFVADPPPGLDDAQARALYGRLAGATAHAARERTVELLRGTGELTGDPQPVRHWVKFYEKGDRPLEIVTTRQWYIRNGGRDEDLREQLRGRGRELEWHPEHMRVRYENWVAGLNGDWLISRQRFFGVPIPVWYRLDDAGDPIHDQPLTPPESALPVDPSTDVPEGFREQDRGRPGGFVGDPDVMDTWATSSLSPQIAGGWGGDEDLFARVFPMDVRPQAHEIIRTWLFATVVRAHLEQGVLPWRHAAISGWILDPDRKKMSKSKGNALTPADLLAEHGADAVRYWAASGRPGTDTAFDVGQMKIGRRLAIKILNASRFALSIGAAAEVGPVTHPLDAAMLAGLADLVESATAAFDRYDYTQALEAAEQFFWGFCDDYLELIKDRAYGEFGEDGAGSARAALALALSVLLRLFAPFLPFATEEVWSWWQDGSVHRAAWPDATQLRTAAGSADRLVLATASEVIAGVRKAKSQARVSMRADVRKITIRGPGEALDRFALVETDVRAAGRIGDVELVDAAPADGDGLEVLVSL